MLVRDLILHYRNITKNETGWYPPTLFILDKEFKITDRVPVTEATTKYDDTEVGVWMLSYENITVQPKESKQ